MNKYYRSSCAAGLKAVAGAYCLFLLLGSAASTRAAAPEESTDITNSLSKVVEEMMRTDQIPGVAVTVVKDGSVVLLKGFGFANLDRSTRIDPQQTVFSIASLSKPFTALTALIQVRNNSLTLDTDLRHLAGFALPQSFSQPVTVRQLLTHTSGFDDEEIGDSARSSSELEPLGDYLARRMPPRIADPGTIVKYTNHGTTLLGHAIELASKKTFADMVEESVFRPLGMTSSTFRQQPDSELEARRATAYRLSGKRPVPLPRYFSRVPPAWGMSTTAQDMSRFLLAQLEPVDSALAKSPVGASMLDMHSTQFRQHPKMPGVTFGFFEAEMNGEKALFHEGGMEGFTSYLLLVPEHRLGMFVVQNRRSGDLRRALTKALMDHYFPAAAAPPIVSAEVPTLNQFAGTYRFNRSYYQHNLMKVLALFGIANEVRVSSDAGTLHLDGRQAVPVGPNLFRWQDGPGLVGFGGSAEKPSTLLFSGVPLGAYVRIPWHETAFFHRMILLVAFGVFSGSLLLAGVKRIRKTSRQNEAADPNLSRLSLLTSACYVVLLPGLGAAFAMSANELQFGVPLTLLLMLILALIAAALTVLLVARTVWSLRRGPCPGARLARLLVVPAAGTMTLASLAYWNLLGFWF